MKRRHRAALVAAVVSVVGAVGEYASGQAIRTWGAAGGGTYSTAGNWLGSVVPGATDTAVFSQNLAYNVFFTTSPTITALNLGPGTISFQSITTQRTWTINGDITQT